MKNLFLDGMCLRGDRVLVEGEYFHYLKNVRRVHRGTTLRAVIDGVLYELEVSDVGTESLSFAILSRRGVREDEMSPLRVYQALLKSNKMDLIVARLSELGVEEFVPLASERSVPEQRSGSSRVERWKRIAREGSKITGAEQLMKIGAGRSLAEAARDMTSVRGYLPLVFCAQGGGRHVREILETAGPDEGFILFFGPEGGFTDGEVSLLLNSGAIPVSLGPHVMRSETASIVGTGFVRVYQSGGRSDSHG